MNTLLLILFGFICGLGGYVIGVRRAAKTYQNDYDDGYNAALNDSQYERKRTETLNVLVQGLDDLFEEDKVIDCGEY